MKIFAKIRTIIRFKKWDTSPCPFGINSQTNPLIYKMLLDFKSLSDFELKSILLLFSLEKFTPVDKNEFENWLLSLNPRFMDENFERVRQETIRLAETDEQKYLATLNSFLLFTKVVAKRNVGYKKNGEDPIRNIKKMFCELRPLMNKHVIDPEQK